MFKLMQKSAVWWPVSINEPIDGGKVAIHPCEIEFELLPQSEYELLAQDGDITLLERLVQGWRDILDERGEPLAFNEDNIQALLQVPYVRSSFLQGYMQAVSGAAVKN